MSRFNHMTDEEILHLYRNANVKKTMVQVLADRNCVGKKEIIEFLYENNVLEASAIGAYRRRGLLPPEAKAEKTPANAKPVIEVKEVKEVKAEPIQPVQIPDSVIEAVNKQLEGMEVDYCEAKAVIKEAEEIIRKYEELLNFLEHSKPCASCEI